jgi:hypothetical protein
MVYKDLAYGLHLDELLTVNNLHLLYRLSSVQKFGDKD